MQDSRIVLGDTLNFSTSVPDYLPAAGWVLKFRLIPRAAGVVQTLITVQDPSDSTKHLLQVSAATTSTWAPGIYSWYSYVDKLSSSESYGVDEGVATLIADPRTATTLDLRSPAQIRLDNINAFLDGKASSGILSYRIGDRELQSIPLPELHVIRDDARTEVAREINRDRMSEGLKTNRRVSLRLNRA